MDLLKRRELLKAMGITAGYSFFAPFAARLRAQDRKTLKRLILFYVPNGTNYEDWKPKGYGKSFTPGKVFDPVSAFKNDLIVFDRVKMNVDPRPSNEHQRGLAALWTNQGLNSSNAGAGFSKGISVDQYIANHLQKSPSTATPVKSLNLTIFQGDNNQAFQSFSGNNKPVVPLYNPREAWNLLFEGVKPPKPDGPSQEEKDSTSQQQSVLDFLKNDVNDLKKDLSADEKAKLEEHLEGLREIERRVGLASLNTKAVTCEIPNQSSSVDHPSPNIRSEQEMVDVGRSHLDLIVEGLACGRTNVASIMWDQPAGDATFEFLKNRKRSDNYRLYKSSSDSNYNHHDHSHQYNDRNTRIRKEARESLTIINQWYMEQLEYLLNRLKNRNMLEDTLVVVGSDIATGVHTLENIPIVFGGGSDFFSSAMAFDAAGQSHAKILTTVCRSFGIELERFGSLDKSKGYFDV